jgi:hypothetical protein
MITIILLLAEFRLLASVDESKNYPGNEEGRCKEEQRVIPCGRNDLEPNENEKQQHYGNAGEPIDIQRSLSNHRTHWDGEIE